MPTEPRLPTIASSGNVNPQENPIEEVAAAKRNYTILISAYKNATNAQVKLGKALKNASLGNNDISNLVNNIAKSSITTNAKTTIINALKKLLKNNDTFTGKGPISNKRKLAIRTTARKNKISLNFRTKTGTMRVKSPTQLKKEIKQKMEKKKMKEAKSAMMEMF